MVLLPFSKQLTWLLVCGPSPLSPPTSGSPGRLLHASYPVPVGLLGEVKVGDDLLVYISHVPLQLCLFHILGSAALGIQTSIPEIFPKQEWDRWWLTKRCAGQGQAACGPLIKVLVAAPACQVVPSCLAFRELWLDFVQSSAMMEGQAFLFLTSLWFMPLWIICNQFLLLLSRILTGVPSSFIVTNAFFGGGSQVSCSLMSASMKHIQNTSQSESDRQHQLGQRQAELGPAGL